MLGLKPLLTAISLFIAPNFAAAQEYPIKPIRVD